MPLKDYGVVVGKLDRVEQEPTNHYGRWFHGLVYVDAPEQFTCAVDVSSPVATQVQYVKIDVKPEDIAGILALEDQPGFHLLAQNEASGALDFVRTGWLKRVAPPDCWSALESGQDALGILREVLTDVQTVFIFGQFFADLGGKKGLHNIHMNQGDPPGQHQKDDGIWQDGGTIALHNDGTLSAFFSKFAPQSFHTDEHGLPVEPAVPGKVSPAPAPPPRAIRPELAAFWDAKVSELFTAPPLVGDAAGHQFERYRLYCLMLLGLVSEYFNGNRYGATGSYPSRADQRRKDGSGQPIALGPSSYLYEGGDYLGHNIAAVAVDAVGRVIDFDFNHNQILASSVEHAESRLVRRLFSLVGASEPGSWQRSDGPVWNTGHSPEPPRAGVLPVDQYATTLPGVTIYTSLEPCAQCTGIMSLAKIKEVVYVQHDPGAYDLAAALYNISLATKPAPTPVTRPVPAAQLCLKQARALDEAYVDFMKRVGPLNPFYVSPAGQHVNIAALASFLCTDTARATFRSAVDDFRRYELDPASAAYAPDVKDDRGKPIQGVLTNQEVIEHLRRFLQYAIQSGDRGTPHRV